MIKNLADYIEYYEKLLMKSEQYKILSSYGRILLENIKLSEKIHVSNNMTVFFQLLTIDAKLQLLDYYISYMKSGEFTEDEIIQIIDKDSSVFYKETLGYAALGNEDLPVSLLLLEN